MSLTDAVTRISQIQAELASVKTAFDPAAAQAASSSAAGSAGTAAGGGGASFASMLAQASAGTAVGAAGSPLGTVGTSLGASGSTLGAPGSVLGTAGSPLAAPGIGSVSGAGGSVALPASASTMLTSAQQEFAARLAADTGLSPSVVCAWLLAEESGGAAQARQAQGNNDWLNIGYTDSGTYGSSDSIWSDPITAADATAGWLRGQSTIPGYGTASGGIQAILATAGQPPAEQVAAIQQSGWASSGYPDLPSLLAQVGV